MGNPTIFTNALLAVGTGTASADRDISGRLRSLKWDRESEDHDVTCMGSTTRVHALGLEDQSFEAQLLMSFTTADGDENIDALLNTLYDLSATGKSFKMRVRPVNACTTASNPEYSMLAKLAKRTIMDGEVGAVLETPITLLPAGSFNRASSS